MNSFINRPKICDEMVTSNSSRSPIFSESGRSRSISQVLSIGEKNDGYWTGRTVCSIWTRISTANSANEKSDRPAHSSTNWLTGHLQSFGSKALGL